MREYIEIETIFIKFSHHHSHNNSLLHIFNVCCCCCCCDSFFSFILFIISFINVVVVWLQKFDIPLWRAMISIDFMSTYRHSIIMVLSITITYIAPIQSTLHFIHLTHWMGWLVGIILYII